MSYPDQLTIETALKAQGWPPALIAATTQSGNYALGLIGAGRVITFSDAVDLGNGWALVKEQWTDSQVEIQIRQIQWAETRMR